MKLSLAIAEKLLLLWEGAALPASKLKYPLISELVEEGLIIDKRSGRTKSILQAESPTALQAYLHNKYAIADLRAYITTLRNSDADRAMLIEAANNSKIVNTKTFKGFLVNSYIPIEGILNNSAITIHPAPGSFQFIYDIEQFRIPPEILLVGVENAENFRHIAKLKYLFTRQNPLFVCRYPQQQGKHFISWLLANENQYLHFGDLDPAGINIYYNEYKKHLDERARFFVPSNIEELLQRFGNRNLYDVQQLHNVAIAEPDLIELIALLHKYKKGLEQEALLIGR